MGKLVHQPGQLLRELYAKDTFTGMRPNMGEPPAVSHSGDIHHVCLALNPTGTLVTLELDAGAFNYDNTNVRLQSLSHTLAFAVIRHLRIWMRRKPGTTAAMVSQEITFGGSDGTTMYEMGRLFMSAAAAGAEPVSDVYDQSFHAGNDYFTIEAGTPFMIGGITEDAPLEIVVELYGTAA